MSEFILDRYGANLRKVKNRGGLMLIVTYWFKRRYSKYDKICHRKIH